MSFALYDDLIESKNEQYDRKIKSEYEQIQERIDEMKNLKGKQCNIQELSKMTRQSENRIDLGKLISSQEEGKPIKLNFEINTEFGAQKTRVVLPYLGTGMKFLQRGFISADPYDKINSPHYLLGKLIDYINLEDELFFLYEMQMFEDQNPRATLYASKIKDLNVQKSDISESEIFSNKVRAHKVIADLKDRNDPNVQSLLNVFSKYEDKGKYRAVTSWG